ncbi:uncharacterized protein B0H18DRAFT_1115144 [Fomitopsis serialis]|uniref:uncharacterized protein n=1 Tax=Fomitopsis serialis TaxID=139415 RepID=UPI00200833EC|nr:uncharacterized protein B0H18DRAFT_1115144 [Neoantrodia serialis]KAH9933763.1 hypothetical protein B0H18DRAFT_1115144 [Neoantrodia serialis]
MRKGNFEVLIKSEGRELPEYQLEAVDDKTVACYIRVKSERPSTSTAMATREATNTIQP